MVAFDRKKAEALIEFILLSGARRRLHAAEHARQLEEETRAMEQLAEQMRLLLAAVDKSAKQAKDESAAERLRELSDSLHLLEDEDVIETKHDDIGEDLPQMREAEVQQLLAMAPPAPPRRPPPQKRTSPFDRTR